jgi:hypothetical protein
MGMSADRIEGHLGIMFLAPMPLRRALCDAAAQPRLPFLRLRLDAPIGVVAHRLAEHFLVQPAENEHGQTRTDHVPQS